MNKFEQTHYIKSLAEKLGFMYCGIAKAEKLEDDARRLEQWLSKGFQGTMHYMERYFEQRIDPRVLVPEAKSVITLALNYFPQTTQKASTPLISKYAYGKDYHEIIKQKLKIFLLRIQEKIGDVQGRGFVDSAPVLERTWALRSGLGWIGKNGNLINNKSGSYFFLATLIIDLELQYDDFFAKDYCGTCSRCVEACPTDAILPNKVVNGSKCISYFTIELKENILPQQMKLKWNDWMFGCDVCQDVCPWNRFSKPTNENEFTPLFEILNFNLKEWENLTEHAFKKIFKHSPIKRTKFSGIQRNLKWLKSNESFNK